MQKILSVLRKACSTYSLIEEGDKIAVGISGGKDSLTLLNALAIYQRFSPQNFSLVAIAVDLSGGKNDYSEIKEFCDKINIEFTIVPSNPHSLLW